MVELSGQTEGVVGCEHLVLLLSVNEYIVRMDVADKMFVTVGVNVRSAPG
jgi:hypothetical protein